MDLSLDGFIIMLHGHFGVISSCFQKIPDNPKLMEYKIQYYEKAF